MPKKRDHIESRDPRSTRCSRKVAWCEGEVRSLLEATLDISWSGIGNYCRRCAHLVGLWSPSSAPDWQPRLVTSIFERLCKGKYGCDAGAKSEQSGPCAGCSHLFDIAEEMGVSNLLDGRIEMYRSCLDSLVEASGG